MAAPAATEEPADLATDFSAEMPDDMGVDTTGDVPAETPAEAPAEAPEGEENPDEPILKTVQKLTGKLTQKMRDGAQELESKDYKYVVNSILSAIDMTKVNEEDMADMLSKLQNKDSEDTTDAEPAPEETPVDVTPEEPMQEQPSEYLKRIQKSVMDEFLKR
jgi:hypothetical protein